MNERYGRNAPSNQRTPNYRDRQADHDRPDYDHPRQPQQWHDEAIYGGAPGRDRPAAQMGSVYGGYSGAPADYDPHRGESLPRDFGDQPDGARETGRRDRVLYPATHRQGYGGAQSDYGSGYASFTGSDYGGRDFVSGNRTGYGAGLSSFGASSDVGGDYGTWRSYGEERGFLARAGDEIASWFGNEDAKRRREMDHRGRGPANYKRSDDRITDDANDALTRDWIVDASDITVTVTDGEATLEGFVGSRAAKRRAEDCVEDVFGVKHVQNNLRVKDFSARHWDENGDKNKRGAAAGKSPTNAAQR
ncbi:MAG: BON domain-containing protein [Novosphingobium sp.]|nr:BON domain-containing protein [Novosphingobium sp.]